jgi:hypothetical protein
VLEAPAAAPGFGDIAVVREAIEERRRHLGVAEDPRPLGEGKVGRHDDRRCARRGGSLCERQVAQFVEHKQVDASDAVGQPPTAAKLHLGLEFVDEVDGVEEARLAPGSDDAPCNADCDVALAGGPADEDNVALLVEARSCRQLLDQLAVDRRALKGEVGQLLGQRQLGDVGSIVLASRRPVASA